MRKNARKEGHDASVRRIFKALTADQVPSANFDLSHLTPEQMDALNESISRLPLNVIPGIASRILGLLRSAQIESTTDKVTRLPNRRGIIDTLTQKIEAMKRGDSQEVIVVGFCDLDGFKNVNDECGHEVGDQALRDVAAALKEKFGRKDDIVARGRSAPRNTSQQRLGQHLGRYGGDEIILQLAYRQGRNFNEEIVRAMIRESLSGLVYWGPDGKPYPIGASIGFAVLDPSSIDLAKSTEDIVSDILREADKAMYLDKWGPEGKKGMGTEAENEDAPKFVRLRKLRLAATNPSAPSPPEGPV